MCRADQEAEQAAVQGRRRQQNGGRPLAAEGAEAGRRAHRGDHPRTSSPLTQATKIGVAVGKLRTHADTRVSDLAKELVKSWKTQVEKQRREGSAKDKPKKDAAPAPAPAPAEAPPKPAAPVNIDFEVLNDKTRNACLKLLYSSLELAPNADAQVVYSYAMQIEQATLDTVGSGSVNGDYRAKIRSLSLNLKDKNNPELREQVLLGEIAPEQLVVMRSEVCALLTPGHGLECAQGRARAPPAAKLAQRQGRRGPRGRDRCVPVRQVQAAQDALLPDADTQCR